MKNKVRIGKDFTIRWAVVTSEGEPYAINADAAILRIYSPYGVKEAIGFIVSGNIIEWVFKGKDQKHLGDYTIELVENNGRDGMLSVDFVEAFTLVAHTNEESLNDEGAVEIQTIELTSQIALAPVTTGGGGSYDDTKIKQDIADLQAKDVEMGQELTELSSEVSKKQDTISDLATIRSGAAKGATAIQEVKTINGQSIIGSGNIEIQGGGSGVDASLETLPNGNLKVTIDGVSKDFMPATPSGDPQHYAYVNAGAEYNDTGTDIVRTGIYGDSIVWKAGCWWLNELGDLTNEEMREIYARKYGIPAWLTMMQRYFNGINTRTALICEVSNKSGVSLDYTFQSAKCVTVSFAPSNNPFSFTGAAQAFTYASNLQKIITPFKITSSATPFDYNYELREFRIMELKYNLALRGCEKVSNASILYMINNEAAATTPITITLHKDVYARAMADAEITAALAAHPNVSLASA